MFKSIALLIACGTATQPAAEKPIPSTALQVFETYQAAVEAGDGPAVAVLVGEHPVPTPFTFCPPTQDSRECLIDYLDRTVVNTHSVITPIRVTVHGDTVEAKLEVRNDLTRAAGVERVAGTDRITVAGGRIVAFAFLRDEADSQTQKFFRYMMSTMHPGGPGPAPDGGAPKPPR